VGDAALADLIALVHLLLVVFVVAGFVLVLVGAARGWAWVRNPWFRAIHLGITVVVALEAAFGCTCPLTTWERELRRDAGQTVEDISFVGQLARRVLFLDLPEWVFPILHVGFGLLVIAGFVFAPPRLRRTQRR
jgi:hypothetical protein